MADWVLGAIGGGMIVVALAILVFGSPGASDGGGASVPTPALRLLAPVEGATVSEAVLLRFEIDDGRLTWTPTGWGADGLHIHAEIDGREVMPGRNDIVAEGERYSWSLAGVAPGEVEVRLVWSDARHRAVDGGASDPVQVVVAPAAEGADP